MAFLVICHLSLVTCTERSRKACGIATLRAQPLQELYWSKIQEFLVYTAPLLGKKTNDIELIQTMSQGMPVALPLGGRGFSWTND